MLSSEKNIVALCYAHALGHGGYPQDTRSLATALHKLGIHVILCVNTAAETLEGLDSEIPIWDFSDLISRFRELRCVHIFGIFIPEQIKAMGRLQHLGVTIILSPWAQLLPNALVKSRIKKYIFLLRYRKSFKLVQHWSVFSETEWESVTRCFGKAIGQRAFSGLGHYPSCQDQTQVTSSFKRENVFKILYFGRCDFWQKGIDILLESFVILCKLCTTYQLPPPNLTIAGRPWLDSESRYEKHVQLHGNEFLKRITDVPEEDIKYLYDQADLFTYLSRFDGPPRPLRMAIEFGVPVLASFEANMSEEIALLEAGTSTSLKPSEVAARMFELMCSWQQRRNNSTAENPTYRQIVRDCSWDIIAERFAHIYSTL